MKLNVVLDETDLKQLIKEALEKKFDHVGEIEFVLGTKYSGNQRDGYYEGTFKHVKVSVQ